MAEFEHMNPTPPHEREQTGAEGTKTGEAQTTEQVTEETVQETEASTGGEQTTETEQTEQTTGEGEKQTTETTSETTEQATEQATEQVSEQPDTFFDDFNKRYGKEFKDDEEVKSLFGVQDKLKDLEEKYSDYDDHKKNAEQYKQELEDTKVTYMSDLLSKPLMKQAFVASQLQEKHPSLDKDVLAELAMADLNKMDDLEVIAKERKMRSTKSSLDNIKAVIKKEVGIDPETTPEEWDGVAKTELEMKAADAKERIAKLLEGVEMPKIISKEEREAEATKLLEEKKKQAQPFKDVFTKFDAYKNGEFEFTAPDEFKEQLPNIFDQMFVNAGLELTEENIATAELIKKALFLEEYFPKMKEVIEKQVEARVKEETDKELHNDEPPNTTTASEQETEGNPNQPSLNTFFQNQRGERATSL